MRLLVVTPTRREANALVGTKLVCGSGSAAADSVSARLEREPVDAVAVVGVCGGLDPALAAGDLVLASRVIAAGQPDRIADAALLAAISQRLRAARRTFATAALLTVAQPVVSTAEKQDLWNRYGAAGVDMETYAVVQAIEARSLPWFALRSVVDPAQSSLPAPLASWRGDENERALIRALARRPDTWLAVARLALQMRRATDALTRSVPLAMEAGTSLPSAIPSRAAGTGPA